MVGDTLFRSADGKSHCPICKGKVSWRVTQFPAAHSAVCAFDDM
jgi:uncharacterized Zn finger protein (UPF0148 family)